MQGFQRSFVGEVNPMTTATGSDIDIGRLDRIRRKLELSWEDLAATIGVNPSTLSRWRSQESQPRPMARSRLIQIDELMQMLQRLFAGSDHAREWLKNQHPEMLDRQTPLEVMRAGRIDRVLTLLHFLARGA
jgi:DNA-binding transcriptional regulator YiaG